MDSTQPIRLSRFDKLKAPSQSRGSPRRPRSRQRLLLAPARNAEAVKNYARGVGTIEGIEMNTGDVVIQKVVTLFQGEVNTDAADHFRIVFTSL